VPAGEPNFARPGYTRKRITQRREVSFRRFLTDAPGTASVPGVSVEFLLTSLVVVLIPGTGVIYTVSSSIGGGRRRGLIAAVGCTLGIVPHMLAAMLGLSGIMQAGSAVFEVVRWAGVAYLVFMGFSMIREAGGCHAAGRRERSCRFGWFDRVARDITERPYPEADPVLLRFPAAVP
jgi:hypothetical protein